LRTSFKLACLALALTATTARAAEEAELVEKVVVKNRLYSVAGRWELGLYGGFTLLPRLTEHYNLNLGVAINVVDSLAIELRAGYAISRHTGLADQISADFFQSVVAGGPAASAPVTDMSDLWQMGGNAALGLRWQPIYGKISLFSEGALHFQFYVWLGGGVGLFTRESIIICNERSGGECSDWYDEFKAGPVVSLALGMRLFLPLFSGKVTLAFRVEARTWSWLDSYLQGVNRVQALNGATPEGGGTASPAAGVTTLSQIDIGPALIF
jgi:outer membrane beta-barrel protein